MREKISAEGSRKRREINSPIHVKSVANETASEYMYTLSHCAYNWNKICKNPQSGLTTTTRGGLGRLAARHLPGRPVGPPARWAATSNVDVGQTTYHVNRRRVGREGREGSEGQSHKGEEREGGSGTGKKVKGPLARDGGLYLDICPGVSGVPSYVIADVAGLPT